MLVGALPLRKTDLLDAEAKVGSAALRACSAYALSLDSFKLGQRPQPAALSPAPEEAAEGGARLLATRPLVAPARWVAEEAYSGAAGATSAATRAPLPEEGPSQSALLARLTSLHAQFRTGTEQARRQTQRGRRELEEALEEAGRISVYPCNHVN